LKLYDPTLATLYVLNLVIDVFFYLLCYVGIELSENEIVHKDEIRSFHVFADAVSYMNFCYLCVFYCLL
jgi:hypothetical protein